MKSDTVLSPADCADVFWNEMNRTLSTITWYSDVDMLEEFAYVWTQGVVLDLLPTSAKYGYSLFAHTGTTNPVK